jgi:hypothetical protein
MESTITGRPVALGSKPEQIPDAAHTFEVSRGVEVICLWVDGAWKYAFAGESIEHSGRTAPSLEAMIRAASMGF